MHGDDSSSATWRRSRRIAVAVDAAVLEEQDGAPQAALRRGAAASAVGRVRVGGPLPRTRRRSSPATAAQDRACGSASGWSAAGARACGDDEEQRPRRRLLEVLQEGVGGAGVHVVGGVDDGDAPPPLARRRAEEADARGGSRRPELGPVALVLRPRAAAGRGGWGGRDRRPCGRPGVLGGTDRSGAAATAAAPDRDGPRRSGRSGRPASPCRSLRSAEQPGVVHAAAAISVEQGLLGAGLAEPAGCSSGGGQPSSPSSRGIFVQRHHAARREEPCRDGLPDGVRDVVLAGGRVDDDAALGLAGGDLEVGLPPAHAGPSRRSRSGRGRRRSLPGARDARSPTSAGTSRISVRSGRFCPTAMRSSASRVAGATPPQPLIDAGGIGEAVGEHPLARAERRTDQLDMVGAGGGEEQRLGLRARAPRRAGQDDLADRLGRRRAAGLPRRTTAPARSLAARRAADLGRFACPLPAFERDELAEPWPR